MNNGAQQNILVSTVNGIDIYLEAATGKFVAEVNGRLLRMANVRNLENKIMESIGDPVYAILLSSRHQPSKPRKAKVLGWDKRTSRMITEHGKLSRFDPDPIPYTDETWSDLTTLYEAWVNAGAAFLIYVAEKGTLGPVERPDDDEDTTAPAGKIDRGGRFVAGQVLPE